MIFNKPIKVMAFDVFGTVFNMDAVPRDELRRYGEHIHKPKWSALQLPSSWEKLPAYTDAAAGIAILRHRFLVVTCSNGPLGLLAKASKYNGISWDAIVPLEMNRVFKPNPAAYLTVCEVMGVAPNEVAMVTANKDFGDLEASGSLGMTPILIRHPEGQFNDILEMSKASRLLDDLSSK